MTGERGHILVVDDNENLRRLLRDILGGPHDVALASDGVVAKSLLDAEPFEVVLTDVRMPGPDGFELVRFAKERWPLTEVVMMTAYGSVPAAVEAMREGAYDYIEKPFDPDDVTLVVTRALARYRERTSVQSAVGPPSAPLEAESLAALSYRAVLAYARDRSSREYLNALLKVFGGNVSHAAERAGLERESLHRLLRRYHIHAEAFRESGGPRGNHN